jgi:hypothetical protein
MLPLVADGAQYMKNPPEELLKIGAGVTHRTKEFFCYSLTTRFDPDSHHQVIRVEYKKC